MEAKLISPPSYLSLWASYWCRALCDQTRMVIFSLLYM